MVTLLPFQEIGKKFLIQRREAILADDMGLGKTYQAIAAIREGRISSGVIVCPHTVRHTWVKKIREEIPNAFVKEIITSKTMPDPCAINVVNYDIVWREPLVTYFKDITWPLLLCDESHYLRTAQAKRTKTILGRNGIYSRCDRRWMMTGTPVLNRPIELYPVLRALFPEHLGKYADYYSYGYKFCSGMQGPFGFDCTGASNLDLLARILSPVMLRRLKEDVLTELPEIFCDKVYLDPTDKLLSLIEKENRALDMKQTVGEISSIRRALGVIKAHAAVKHLENLLEEKEKIVVYVWHKDVGDILAEAFKDKHVLFRGTQSAKEKETAKNKFINDPTCRLFIGNIASSGVGLDELQHVCDTCLFVEISYVPKEIEQAMDRLHRMGQKRNVLVQFLVAENSEDERVIETITQKAKNINTILQERRGNATSFVSTKCHCCKKEVEITKLKRVLKLTVCEDCKKSMECFL